jgi:RNA polymerase sigma-70 factor, ECF subfamily
MDRFGVHSASQDQEQPTEPEDKAGHAVLESIYRQHFAAVWRLLRRLGVPPAQLDDAAQDVFLVVQKKLGQLTPEGSPQRWVFAIAVRIASEYRRRSRRRRTEPLDDTFASANLDPAHANELRETVRLLHELLGQLDDARREVFVLAELEQLSAPEIADVLQLNLNTVYARLRSARKAFDAALARSRAAAQRRRRA